MLLLGANANTCNLTQMSLLHFSAMLNDREIIDLLIEFGGDLEKTDKYGRLPIDYAEANGCSSIVQYIQQMVNRKGEHVQVDKITSLVNPTGFFTGSEIKSVVSTKDEKEQYKFKIKK